MPRSYLARNPFNSKTLIERVKEWESSHEGKKYRRLVKSLRYNPKVHRT